MIKFEELVVSPLSHDVIEADIERMRQSAAAKKHKAQLHLHQWDTTYRCRRKRCGLIVQWPKWWLNNWYGVSFTTSELSVVSVFVFLVINFFHGRCLTDNRGCWHDGVSTEELRKWKLAPNENFSRMRTKLLPDLSFDLHTDARFNFSLDDLAKYGFLRLTV